MSLNLSFVPHKISNEFTKYYFHGIPFYAVLHHFTEADKGNPHDHPFGFYSHVLFGGYVERIYRFENGKVTTQDIERFPGTSHFVSAETIHEIISLPHGECFTVITPNEHQREWYEWQFREDGIFFKPNNETEFKLYQP